MEKNFLLQKAPTFNIDGILHYQVHLITNANTKVSPPNAIHICAKSIVSYEECYVKLLDKLLESLDQVTLTEMLKEKLVDGFTIE